MCTSILGHGEEYEKSEDEVSGVGRRWKFLRTVYDGSGLLLGRLLRVLKSFLGREERFLRCWNRHTCRALGKSELKFDWSLLDQPPLRTLNWDAKPSFRNFLSSINSSLSDASIQQAVTPPLVSQKQNQCSARNVKMIMKLICCPLKPIKSSHRGTRVHPFHLFTYFQSLNEIYSNTKRIFVSITARPAPLLFSLRPSAVEAEKSPIDWHGGEGETWLHFAFLRVSFSDFRIFHF